MVLYWAWKAKASTRSHYSLTTHTIREDRKPSAKAFPQKTQPAVVPLSIPQKLVFRPILCQFSMDFWFFSKWMIQAGFNVGNLINPAMSFKGIPCPPIQISWRMRHYLISLDFYFTADCYILTQNVHLHFKSRLVRVLKRIGTHHLSPWDTILSSACIDSWQPWPSSYTYKSSKVNSFTWDLYMFLRGKEESI